MFTRRSLGKLFNQSLKRPGSFGNCLKIFPLPGLVVHPGAEHLLYPIFQLSPFTFSTHDTRHTTPLALATLRSSSQNRKPAGLAADGRHFVRSMRNFLLTSPAAIWPSLTMEDSTPALPARARGRAFRAIELRSSLPLWNAHVFAFR